MPDEIDWSLTTFEGVRLRHHREFQALSFREKLEALEEMEKLAELLQSQNPALRKPTPGRVAGGGDEVVRAVDRE